jgi:hypothetical protein
MRKGLVLGTLSSSCGQEEHTPERPHNTSSYLCR